MKFHQLNRVLHRWAAILIALPVLLVIGTGILLQVKKEFAWIQPPTQRGGAAEPTLSFDRILEIAGTVPEAAIRRWGDIDRLDVRPGKGMLKVLAKNRWEIQLDATSGEILQVAYRRSDLIESLHDGSFFHDKAKVWVFLPNGLVLLGMWLTGIYLFFLPYYVKRRRRRREAAKARNGGSAAIVLILLSLAWGGTSAFGEAPLPGGTITRIVFGCCAKHWQPQPIWDAVPTQEPALPHKR